MNLQYKPDMQRAVTYWDAFWNKEVIDRPLICINSPKKGFESTRQWHGLTYQKVVEAKCEEDYHRLLTAYDTYAAATSFLGESIPFVKFDYGPDMFASFFGAQLFCSSTETVDTTWVEPIVEDWTAFDGVMKTGEGTPYSQYMKLMEYAAAYSEGKFLLSVPDIHSNMDAMSALRGPQNLCFDLMDYPDEVEEALLRIRKTYTPFYNEIFRVGKMEERGSIGWIPTYSRGRFATVQCDFDCLMSPAQGKKYVIPSIEEEAAALDHVSYHYDGKEALVHLDNILQIEGIDVIQWVPGDGNPRSIEWMDLLHKIQNAGKGLWIYDWTVEEIKTRFKELKPEGLVFSVDTATEDEGYELIEYLTKHM